MAARPNTDPDESRYRGRLGKSVRARREKLGLTIKDLADRLKEHGVSISDMTLYSYELGRRPIQVDDLPAFAAALETTIRKLIPEA